jgi:hypothetical protein
VLLVVLVLSGFVAILTRAVHVPGAEPAPDGITAK